MFSTLNHEIRSLDSWSYVRCLAITEDISSCFFLHLQPGSSSGPKFAVVYFNVCCNKTTKDLTSSLLNSNYATAHMLDFSSLIRALACLKPFACSPPLVIGFLTSNFTRSSAITLIPLCPRIHSNSTARYLV